MEQIDGLNATQAQAVMHDRGPVLVVAGAGTGKTTVISRRIAWLIASKRAKPEEILALTFTDKAAQEMEERVDRLLPYGVVNTNILTFHALGDQILRDQALEIGISTDFQVMSTFQQIIFMQQIMTEMGLSYYAPLGNPYEFLGALTQHFSRLKDECITPKEYGIFATELGRNARTEEDRLEAERVSELANAYRVYCAQSREQAKLDFGDQISLTIELFKLRPNVLHEYQNRYKYILVDEFQDTNFAQNELVKMLSEKHQNIMAVGDDDQSIYRFRGAAIANILDFKSTFPKAKQIVLTENYRSTQEILDSSYKLISHNNPDRLEIKNKIKKRLTSSMHGNPPELIQAQSLPEEMQAVARKVAEVIRSGVEPRDVAILLRKNNQSQAMMMALDAEGVAAESSQRENLFSQPEIKALLNFVAVVNDPHDSAALYGLMGGDIYSLGLASLAELSAIAHRQRLSLEHYIRSLASTDHAVASVVSAVAEYRDHASELTAGQLLYKFIHDQGYLGSLLSAAETSSDAVRKIQNIAHLFGLIREFESVSLDPTIYHFWQYISEMKSADADILAAESPLDQNVVKIMTVHKAKGLEFEVVFVIDLVNEVFPSKRSSEKVKIPEGLISIESSREWHVAEERRLFYVAMTRARQQLYLSFSYDHGGARLRKPSQFVLETLGSVQQLSLDSKTGSVELINQFAAPKPVQHDITAHLYRDGWLNLTPHQIDDYLRDPEKFWLFHVLRLPQGPFHSLVYGAAVHHAIEYYYRNRLAGRKVTIASVQQAFEDGWKSEGFVSKRHEKQRLARGKEVVNDFVVRHKDAELPMLVEQPFSLILPDLKVRIAGRYDAVFETDKASQAVEIRDFKTSQVKDAAAAKRKLKDNIQLAIYALAWERTAKTPVARVSLDFVESGTVVASDIIDHTKTLELIKKAADGIAKHDFRGGKGSIYKVQQPW